MTRLSRIGLPALAMLAIAGWLIFSTVGTAEGDKGLQKSIQGVADAIGKGDSKGAEEMAKKIAKKEEEVYGVMLLLKPRARKGFGVGKEGEVFPDGIELKIRALSRDITSKQKLEKESAALVEMAHRTAAVALISGYLAPSAAAKKKDWMEFNKEMTESTGELVIAIKSGSPAEVKKAATRLNTSCNNCHSKFR